MNVCEELVKKLNENGSYAETLREKILYCIGYLESDDENDDLYNLLTYMLYTEKVYPDEPLVPKYFVPKIDYSKMNDFFTNNSPSDSNLSYIERLSKEFPTFNAKFSTKCKTCKHYKEDVLKRCNGCYHFTFKNDTPDLYEVNKNATK